MASKIYFLLVFFFSAAYVFGQSGEITVSGVVKNAGDTKPLSFANVVLLTASDSAFVTGTVALDDGRFTLSQVKPGNYLLQSSIVGFATANQPLYVGSLTPFIDVGTISLNGSQQKLEEVVINVAAGEVSSGLEKKTFSLSDNINQAGGSVLQAMQNLPGVTVQDGKVQLRGNDKVIVLIDGKQTALTGFGNQTGLDNLPASSIDKIEIINNPSAKYDANGNAGIINIIYKKNRQQGFNGKVGIAGGLGALWIRKENLPTIRPQYQATPKINPSLNINYRKNKVNTFLQADYLYTQTLNKNEFVTRRYVDGTIIEQQTKRNRNTGFLTTKAGVDINLTSSSSLTLSGLYGNETIIDRGDEPFFDEGLKNRLRLWQFLEDEVKTTVMATALFSQNFKQPGHKLNAGFNYTFHREDEKYFFTNILPTFTGKDAFALISDEHVADINFDYTKPLRYGRIEAGIKFRRRTIPTNMQFFPGKNSPIDSAAGGAATYKETIPAFYSTYVYENEKIEAEIGLRVEYAAIRYEVDPNHNTYKSDGYNYTQPFPNVRFAIKLTDNSKLSFFVNRRVDRPNEVDIRIFPKYDDAEIIKVGNPALKPQFTNAIEAGFKNDFTSGYFYAALYHRFSNGTITRIASSIPGSRLIYNIFQNAGRSFVTGTELIFSKDLSQLLSLNLNVNLYRNQVNAFTVYNLYPQPNTFTAETERIVSGNAKANAVFHFAAKTEGQLSAVYFAKDIIPQGTIGERFSLDAGVKKSIQKDRGEIFINATDILNTMVPKREITGMGFTYTSRDYYETQVIRVGYNYKF